MIKKIIVLGSAALVLAGCSTSTPVAVQTVTQTQVAPAPVVTPPTQTLDEKVVEVLHSQNNVYLDRISDDELLSLSKQVCPILDKGMTVRELIIGLVQNLNGQGVTDQEAMKGMGMIVGVAVAAYCPQYDSQVQSLQCYNKNMNIKNVITTDKTIVAYPQQNPKGGKKGGKSK